MTEEQMRRLVFQLNVIIFLLGVIAGAVIFD